MEINKLREVLASLQTKQSEIASAIKHIEMALAILETNQLMGEAPTEEIRNIGLENPSYIDATVDILRKAGKPLHMRVILDQLRMRLSKDLARNSVEASLVRHIRKSKFNAKLTRVGPSTYGLPEWRSSQSVLTLPVLREA